MEKIEKFDGQYAFLSNFYDSPLPTNGGEVIYPTVEHYFQAMKTENPRERERIRLAPTPGKAKRLGRNVNLRADWEEVKQSVMKYALIKKFNNNPELKSLLLETGDAELVEGNDWHDNYWGNCSCAKCANIPGANHLGKLLMEIREDYKHDNII